MTKKYYLEEQGFIIEDYDRQKPFASFLPGVSGTDGIPMWVYYNNRGQGIAGFGVENKDGSILDFVPANQSYRRTELAGFRTFIKKDDKVYEIFSSQESLNVTRKMVIEPNAVGFIEKNESLDLLISVKYYTVTGESYPGLIRKVTVESISGKPSRIELLDGLMTLWPYGSENGSIKDMSNLLTAWFDTFNAHNKLPFFRLRSTSDDSAEVKVVEAGHFFGAFSNKNEGPMDVIYDSEIIFGQNTGLTKPWGFEASDIKDLIAKKQVSATRIPCAYAAYEGDVQEPLVVTSIIGKMNHVDILNEKAKEFNAEYFEVQEQKALKLGEDLTKDVETKTAIPEFDAYVKQSFMDNMLRGGYPLVFEGKDGPIVYHVYSRIHGDMEREYNNFSVEPAYYSHGVGNFRDVNQNRRNDVYFVQEAGLYNVKQFMELIQLDGQNPLAIHGTQLQLDPSSLNGVLSDVIQGRDVIEVVLNNEFTPGKLLTTIDEHQVTLRVDTQEFLRRVIKESRQNTKSAYGHGYWVDHWTYNMDLVDNYLNVYPDRLKELLYETPLRYFLSPAVVLPREDKYVLNAEGKVRQYDATYWDESRLATLQVNPEDTNWEKVKDGQVLKTNLLVKMLSLVLNKITNLDQSGIGIMMNTDKPGWNDAMNGLPGIFGSGTSETIELKRITKFMLKGIMLDESLEVPAEIYALTQDYIKALKQQISGVYSDQQLFEEAQNLKEAFNLKIRLGLSGDVVKVTTAELKEMIELLDNKLEIAIQKAVELGDGIMPTFIVHEAVKFELITDKVHPINQMKNVKVLQWKLRALPLYLEAPARYLKQVKNQDEAKVLYEKLKQTKMYDEKLKMYVTSEPLDEETMEIGRARAFVPGWLERESVFMHMEYKYLLGLLKSGLYDEFFGSIKTALPPFMDPSVYGRSILENSSFIASSRNPDPSNHGRGFVSRLTGTTSELLSMWLYMMAGSKLFEVKGSELFFQLKPILPSDFFDEKDEVSFTLFGDVKIIYSNPLRRDTYGMEKVRIIGHILTYKDGKVKSCENVSGHLAEHVREGLIQQIEVQLG